MRGTPSFGTHLGLLFGLRLRLALNRGGRGGRTLAVLGFLGASLPAVALFLGAFRLLTSPRIASTPEWPPFLLNLLCFVTSAVSCTWPVLSAGVDDHSEVSRYAAFPVTPFRLLIASTLAGLFEPRAIVFSAPLLGAALGYSVGHPPLGPAGVTHVLVGLLAVLYLLLNALLGRVGVHVVLHALKSPRSAQLLGGFFVGFLALCSLLPPVDTSWLTAAGGGVGALRPDVLLNAALALGATPPGFFGLGLELLARGSVRGALLCLGGQAVCGVLAFSVALALLVRFSRRAGRTVGSARAGALRSFTSPSLLRTLIEREALDLWKNPRARLLASVPFILAILVKLLSGRALLVYLTRENADAWLAGSLSLYGALVMASTFSQNAFAYDGHGFGVFLTAPVPLGSVLRAKNGVHAGAAALVLLLLCVFYRVYFQAGSGRDFLLAGLAAVGLIATVLAAGNLLSVYFPVKFHADLKRRDRLPLAASVLGVAGASAGLFPFTFVLRHARGTPVTLLQLAEVAAGAGVSLGLYFALFPLSVRLLASRRERIYAAITRD